MSESNTQIDDASSNEDGDFLDVDAVAAKGLEKAKDARTQLSGAFQRHEIQMLHIEEKSRKLESEFALIRPHILGEGASSDSESRVIREPEPERFSAEEHRSFLDRCLRSMRGES